MIAVLMKGLVARLKAVPAVLNAAKGGIYSNVPQTSKYPYISMDISGDEEYRKDSKAQSYQVVMNSWSRHADVLEAAQIIELAKQAVDRQESAITLDSGVLVRLDFVTDDCYKDPDGVTWHGVAIFKAYIDLGG